MGSKLITRRKVIMDCSTLFVVGYVPGFAFYGCSASENSGVDIAVVGDSLSASANPLMKERTEGTYSDLLAERMEELKTINLSLRGATLDPKGDYLGQFVFERAFSNPAHRRSILSQIKEALCYSLKGIVYWGGTNDILGDSPTLLEDWKRGAYLISSNGLVAVCCTLHNPSKDYPKESRLRQERRLELNLFMTQYVQKDPWGRVLVPTYDLLSPGGVFNPIYGVGDGLHLGVKGHEEVAKLIMGALNRKNET